MNETEFATLSGLALEKIEQGLEASGADLDFELAAGGVLEIEFADGSMIIVNRHAVAQEVWVAARSGGFHFRHDGAVWRDTRDGEELMEKLSRLVTAQAGEPVQLG
jgi:CyaY protein